MITANDIRNKLKEAQGCEGLDAWVSVYLYGKFVQNGSELVHITPHEVEYVQGWNRNRFIQAMQDRGFRVAFYCEDRPCGTCWYKISI